VGNAKSLIKGVSAGDAEYVATLIKTANKIFPQLGFRKFFQFIIFLN